MIFVTGGTGLVGSHLLMKLSEQGSSVKALYRNHIPSELAALPNILWVEGDILDIVSLESQLEGIEKIYHCAAIVSFKATDKNEMLHFNIQGTANVVNASLQCGVRKMVFVSSVAALGEEKKGNVIDETMQWSESSKKSLYGKSKFFSEMEVWRGMGEGLEVAIVNPSIILGEANWQKGSSAIFKSAYNEFPWYTEGTTGFTDVKDVVNAMMLLMESPITGERFIISNQTVSYRDMFSMIAKEFKKRPPYKKVGSLLSKIVWRVEAVKAMFTGKDPLVTKETTQTALSKRTFDNTKLLKSVPGFTYTPLEETIRRVCRYYLQKVN